MGWDSASATPIGHWFVRGWFINRTGRPGEETARAGRHHSLRAPDRPDLPDNLFPGDQLTSSGLAFPTDHPRTALGRGGEPGRYFAAGGEVFFANIGANLTPRPRRRRRADRGHSQLG